MTFGSRLSFVVVLGATLLLSSCSQLTALVAKAVLEKQRQGPDADTLVQVARAYAQGSHASAVPADPSPAAGDAAPAGGSSDGDTQEAEYKNEIMMDLVRKDYDALEKAAREDRSPATRVGGGSWRVWAYYDGVDTPPLGASASDDDWKAQVDAVKAWVAARPDSSAARIALAGVYDSFGSEARGGGYADTVSSDGWRLYNERLGMAASTLVDAAKLKDKSPYWYSLMFDVALAQGWDKSQAKVLMDSAIAFQPSYYHVYRQYANYLLPKWYGEQGEAQAFAEQVSTQLGGQQGEFVYFEIASTIVCGCDAASDRAQLEGLDWARIKGGYATLNHLYGYSTLKANRLAYMAYLQQDKQTAQAAFATIGDNWTPGVWETNANFLSAKAWAESSQGQ